MFKKNQKVVRVIQIRAFKSASLQTVEAVRGGKVTLVDSGLEYDAKTGAEILPVISGCSSELIPLDGE